ncbi:MAG: hypothetical protein IMW97_01330 [Firmicutes bacterium]|nr:hypothetical protein [Candidatus Fermentithermobacillaceae bacterium]
MESFKWHELGQTYEEIAEAFWRLSGLPETFPRDIFSACIWTLPVGVVWISGLTGSAVAAYFPSSGRAEELEQYVFSPLYGCLVASKGAGIIFLEKGLPADEASFTIAHEVSHFLADYLIPRERALSKMGERIRPVLDGERVPDVEERVDALLCGIPLGTYVKATPRERRLSSENRADMLALELLAPARRVLGEVFGAVADSMQGEEGEMLEGRGVLYRSNGKTVSAVFSVRTSCAEIASILVSKYGLPAGVARWYAGYLKTKVRPAGSRGLFREWLEGPGSAKVGEL